MKPSSRPSPALTACRALVLCSDLSRSTPTSATDEKTRVEFAGMLGRMVNIFGGKAAREGVTPRSPSRATARRR